MGIINLRTPTIKKPAGLYHNCVATRVVRLLLCEWARLFLNNLVVAYEVRIY